MGPGGPEGPGGPYMTISNRAPAPPARWGGGKLKNKVGPGHKNFLKDHPKKLGPPGVSLVLVNQARYLSKPLKALSLDPT